MPYLLDTHALLWFLEDDAQLPSRVVQQIKDVRNQCYVSVASLWEIAIIVKFGKLAIEFPF